MMAYRNPEADINPRYIALEGGHNFRDTGGYAVSGGGTTRPGLIYRSGALSRLTPADRIKLNDLGIRTAFDLRSDFENASEGAGSAGDSLQIVRMPTSLGISAIREQLMRDPDAFRLGFFDALTIALNRLP
ncbi:MAG TPA: tyrosine-protein phosphatase [Aggregatilineales bacterium]|nr:tyrosine-protein phosphatase [Aggregatilineales bacterium]